MATYRKRLTDEDGNTIIPAVGDVYGQVYTATLSSSDSTTVTYEFTPECGLMTNSVYAVKFPTPTANLTKTLLLTDGNIAAASVLLPPVASTYQPNFTLATPSNINDTEPWLVMYNGTQWVCLNNKGASFPSVDYSTETAITLPHTATKPEMIIVAAHAVSGAGCIVYVNGYRAFQTNVNTTAVTGMFPVKTGDQVTKVANGSVVDYAYAYDIKWT